MYTSAKPYFYGTGRRKSSVARVRIMQGTGAITINGRNIDDYFGLETLKLIVRQPFEATKTTGTFDVICTVKPLICYLYCPPFYAGSLLHVFNQRPEHRFF